MKTTISTTIDSNMIDDAVEVGFDPQGAAHIMGILSNMYSDAPGAVIREYAANARDSHIKAGQTRPIEVTLPTEWQPNLIVQDWGVGLDYDGILNKLARYGTSTKRDTNLEVGNFGIGAKSALTIGTQYVVTGVLDGIRTVCLLALNARGILSVKPISVKETDLPNGVTVSIAVNDVASITEAATNLFHTWERGTVLVDGDEPECIFDSLLLVGDGIYTGPGSFRSGLRLVMGGIAYPASHNMLVKAARGMDDSERWVINQIQNSKFGITAIVETGSVTITPSREDLRDTEDTIEGIRNVVRRYNAGVLTSVSTEVDKAATALEAVAAIGKYKDMFQNGEAKDFTYKGKALPYKVALGCQSIVLGTGRNGHSIARRDTETFVYRGLTPIKEIEVITGVDPLSGESIRRLAKHYLHGQSSIKRLFLVEADKGEVEWFSWGGDSPVKVTDVETWKENAKAYRPTSSSNRPAGATTYSCYLDGGHDELTAKEIKDLRRRVVVVGAYESSRDPLLELAMDDDDIRVSLNKRMSYELLYERLRAKVTVVRASDLVKVEAQKIVDTITDDDRALLDFRPSDDINNLSRIVDQSQDNLVAEFVKEYAERAAKVEAEAERLQGLRKAEQFVGISRQRSAGADVTQIRSTYPLLDGTLRAMNWSSRYAYDTDEFRVHTTLYINAVDAANNTKED